MDSDASSEKKRKSLLFFAPERSNLQILEAYDIYLHHLTHSDLFDITIMAPNGSPFAAEAKSMGYRMYPMSDFARKLLQRTPQLWPILTATRRYRFDIALSHEGYACRGLSQIARRVVGVCHDDNFEGFAAANRILILNSSTAELAEEFYEEEIPVDILPYPYVSQFSDITPLDDDPDKALTIGASGPFMEEDGLGTFIHAAQLVHEGHPEVKFVIAGKGPLEHDLKELSDHIAPFIDFVGPLDAEEMAEQVDLFCLPAHHAPFSFALCQVMDAGLACLSTCASGPMDILKGGMVAPLVPISDAFLLAVKLQELIEDRSQIARIKKSCFERIREEDFSADIFESRLIKLLLMKPKTASNLTS
ncbi:glycosyltransferase family 4 protein [uncultured Cohaesibacter sp.]|uniref:glycosyltransferase family 4 protein n=1 Tax=uncultured Cohaesibacter sp. TaxID=1002546 RepID=UPI00292FC8A3|nr:glycosyltransferase family 4 protein [uncultured Cohaesibacter sp.]